MEPRGPKTHRAIGKIKAIDKVGEKIADNDWGIYLLKNFSMYENTKTDNKMGIIVEE